MNIKIDPELKALIPPLAPDEYKQLEANIIKDGCRDPLVVWNGTLIDGHNRHEICTRHGIRFDTVEMELPDRDAVMDWMDRNQLGRRNLKPDIFILLLGRCYNRTKKAANDGGKGTAKATVDQNDPRSTAEKLGKQFGVSAPTVKRAGQFADAVEKLSKADPSVAVSVAAGTAKPRKDIIKAAELLETAPEKAKEIISGAKSAADVVREIKRTEIIAKLEDVAAVEAKELAGEYDVIVIDPPWPMEKIERDVTPNQVAFEYPTMNEQELADMKMPAATDCHMWLWTTHKFLPMAFRLLDNWGFKYVCVFVWHKPGGFQPFGLPQYNCEFAIYARKGTPKFIDTKAFPVCFDAARGAHSEKPESFYDVIRRVTAGRRIDIFNRRKIQGFDTWGNESK